MGTVLNKNNYVVLVMCIIYMYLYRYKYRRDKLRILIYLYYVFFSVEKRVENFYIIVVKSREIDIVLFFKGRGKLLNVVVN